MDQSENSGSTIYDVAKLAGVSIATVSRFLNNPEKVNPDTAKAIQLAVNQLGYFRQGNAGSKASRQIGRVGVLTPFFPAPSFVQRLQGMTPVFRQANYEMVIYTVDTTEQLNEYLHSLPFMRRLDGLIIMSMIVRENDSHRLIQSGLQVVMVEHANPLFSRVICDNTRGGQLAAAHFLSRGYGPCAFIGDRVDLSYSLHPTDERLEGFRDGLLQGGQGLDPAYVKSGEASVEGARKLSDELLDLPHPPRAIFAASDLMATGVLKAARARGLHVPRDLAILGFDDIEMADYLDLSTVSQRLTESGRLAAELLVARIREPHRPLQTINLDVQVIERSTT
jgi:LacI family transcriptional regulator